MISKLLILSESLSPTLERIKAPNQIPPSIVQRVKLGYISQKLLYSEPGLGLQIQLWQTALLFRGSLPNQQTRGLKLQPDGTNTRDQRAF